MSDEHDSQTHLVYLGLGSNMGDRDAHLAAALDALGALVSVTCVSAVYDTAPLHVTDQPRFHNLVCEGMTALTPTALLHGVKKIERQLGRTAGPRFGPRVIDIDLLFYDQLVLSSDELTLPHLRLAERAFVLAPLAEIAPSLLHPTLGATVETLLQRLLASDVRRVGPLPHTQP